MKISDIFTTEDDMLEYLDTTPCTFRGAFSEVWDLSDLSGRDVVLKVTKDLCYLEFLKFIKLNPTLRHLPNILDHIVIPDLDDENFILMDKLQHTDKFNNEIAQMHGWWENDVCAWLGESDTLDETLLALEKYFLDNANLVGLVWDLRDSNIMQDVYTGDLVITDPWSESQY